MKHTIIHGLIAGLAAGSLVACGGGNTDSSSGSKMLATTAACYAAWNSTTAYVAGNTASYAGVNYHANFWTQNQNPSTNNGGAGSGQPWTSEGACGATPTPTPAPTPTPTPAPTPTPTPAPTPTPTPAPTPTPTPAPTPTSTCTLQAEDYSTAFDDSTGNAGGAYRTGDVDIEATTDTGGGYNVGWINTGEWLAHNNVTFPTTGTYTIQYRVASPNATGVISADLNAGSIQLGTTAVPNTGGYQTWTTVQRTVTVNAGTYNLGTYFSTGGFNLNWIKVVGATCSPTPTPAPTPTPTPAPTPAPTPTPTPAGWILSWADEFNGTALDTSKWNYEVNCDGGGNGELQCYTSRPENVSVTGGNLVITARQESYLGHSYTSGRLNTSGKFSQTYGRFEARIKIPVGQGTWPAFWMLGQNLSSGVAWPKCGEIDNQEHVNNDAPNYGTIHWADAGGNHVQYGNPSGALDWSQYHTYVVEWDTNAIKWFVDGVQYNEANIANNINSTEEFHLPFFLIANLAIGGAWPGSPNGSIPFPQQMLIDYVRVYHK